MPPDCAGEDAPPHDGVEGAPPREGFEGALKFCEGFGVFHLLDGAAIDGGAFHLLLVTFF